MSTNTPPPLPPLEPADRPPRDQAGSGGETHQTVAGDQPVLTTNQGTPVSDNQNSLRPGARGPTLLEDFVLREKITHFDHERIPERIVHARGSGAHGYFEPYTTQARLTRAAFLADPLTRTDVFVRFSTVVGGVGSGDLHRDVRGFAVKFYTSEGNFDLVGNNMPVFFIQDAIKFPDLVHAVKMEPDRGFPSASSAHDTFWDFVSLMPETIHMLQWVMSDRAIPRSFRMMEGFGVHTFRFITVEGVSTFVKFHWRPKLGGATVVWDEAVKINGADPDFHRRDLWEAIDRGDYPEWELSVQTSSSQHVGGFDILDATKLIPEELLPLVPLGRMVLNRNPDNFFAETEQVAFHPGHMVPGVDVTDDPLLQGRLHSYIDTQLKRLGGPNFHEIPVNRARCPVNNFQRDGHMQMDVPTGRVAYEPNSLAPQGPRESPDRGFQSAAVPVEGVKARVRSPSFSDHYSQARLFFRSQTEPEQRHIVSAFVLELGKVETLAIRRRMLGHLELVDPALGSSVAAGLGMVGEAELPNPACAPVDLPRSPALSLVAKSSPTLKGRSVGVLVTDGADGAVLDALSVLVENEGGRLVIVAPRVGGFMVAGGGRRTPHFALAAAPSVFFDAVAMVASVEGAGELIGEAAAVDWVRDAFMHLKVIGFARSMGPLLEAAGVKRDAGVVGLEVEAGRAFVLAACHGRIWAREPGMRPRP